MNSWYNNSVSQFAGGIVVGVGAYFVVSRYIVSSSNNVTDIDDSASENEIRFGDDDLDNAVQIDRRRYLSAQSSQESFVGLQRPSITECVSLDSEEDDQGKCALVGLLFQILKKQNNRRGYIHRGISCNNCNANPICGTRFKCANCTDYDLCEDCESECVHNRTHVFIKIRYPIPPLANPKPVALKVFYPGNGKTCAPLRWDEILDLKRRSKFAEVEIDCLFEQYSTLAADDHGITREAFNQCLGPLGRQKNLVVQRMFHFYDQDHDGFISFQEFVCSLSILLRASQHEKVKYVFEGYDIDGKGYLVYNDFHQMFKAYFNISIELVRDYIKTCEEEMKSSFDEAADKPVSSVFHAPIPPEVSQVSNRNLKSLHQLPNPCAVSANNSGARPLMEAMSQDAIDEIVSNVFRSADLDNDGKITFEEFQKWALLDSTVLGWFDALGTVF